MTRVCRAGVLLLCSALVVLSSSAIGAQPPAELKEIEAYRLTPEGLRKVIAVNRTLVQEMLKDPKLQQAMTLRQEIERLHDKDELSAAEDARLNDLEQRMEQLEQEAANPLGGDVQSLAEMEARIRTYPPMMQALQREDLAPREYATFWLVFLQAAVVHGFQQSGMLKALPAGVHPENVKFIAEHASDIEAMQKEFEALGARQP
jgi:hypothetical protein